MRNIDELISEFEYELKSIGNIIDDRSMNSIPFNAYINEYNEGEKTLDMLKAYKDGRCVVLPCKVGDTVYCIANPYNVTGDYDDFDKPKTVYECIVESISMYLKSSQIRLNFNNKFIAHYLTLDDFGKSVFLTRSEAEAALKGEKG